MRQSSRAGGLAALCQGTHEAGKGSQENKFSGLTLLTLSTLFLGLSVSLNPTRSQRLWESIDVAHIIQPPGTQRTVQKGEGRTEISERKMSA